MSGECCGVGVGDGEGLMALSKFCKTNLVPDV